MYGMTLSGKANLPPCAKPTYGSVKTISVSSGATSLACHSARSYAQSQNPWLQRRQSSWYEWIPRPRAEGRREEPCLNRGVPKLAFNPDAIGGGVVESLQRIERVVPFDFVAPRFTPKSSFDISLRRALFTDPPEILQCLVTRWSYA
jgi:hypothetical protein